MTQQYLLGQLSTLLGEMQTAAAERTRAVRALRLEVESSSPLALPRLASDAMTLSDTICWTALERGDPASFAECAEAAADLLEFASTAELLPASPVTTRHDHGHGA